jgi:hypothetical protein
MGFHDSIKSTRKNLMLSQGNPFNFDYATPQKSASAKNYKPTDIFHLSPQGASPRKVLDRNRSSVFDLDPVESKVSPRVDRMASDLFFVKQNAPTFGSYQPSVGQARRSTPRDKPEPAAPEIQAEPTEPSIREYEYQEKVEETRQEPESVPEYGNQYREYEEYVTKPQPISSIFDADTAVPLRGSRRHFQQQQSVGIFESEVEPPPRVERFVRHEAPEEKSWVPSVKQTSQSTSFSNLFGDWAEIDRSNRDAEPKRGFKQTYTNVEKLTRVSGLSSEDLNRSIRGKGRRSNANESQIWF